MCIDIKRLRGGRFVGGPFSFTFPSSSFTSFYSSSILYSSCLPSYSICSELLHLESLNECIRLWNCAHIKANMFPWQQHKLGIDLRQTRVFIYFIYFVFNWFHLITINILLMFWTTPRHTHKHAQTHTHTHTHTHAHKQMRVHNKRLSHLDESPQLSPGHDVLRTNSAVHGVRDYDRV